MKSQTRSLLVDQEVLELLPDHSDLFAVADAVSATQRPRRRSRVGLMVLTAALAAGGAALAFVGPWRSGPSFVEQALAEGGSGRYVHAVFRQTDASTEVLDLGSGRTRPVVSGSEVLYDTETGSYQSRFSIGGAVFAPGQAGSVIPDVVVTHFTTGYRKALEEGEARIVGETNVDGQDAKILRFPVPIHGHKGEVVENLVYQDVAVAAGSYTPLWIRGASRVFTRTHRAEHIYAPPCPCTRVKSINSSNDRPRLPEPRPKPRSLTGDVTDIRELSPADTAEAAAALRHAALWPGPVVAGDTIQKIRLQRVTTSEISGALQDGRQIGSARGLRLDYSGMEGSLPIDPLQIDQVASPQAGYGFGNGDSPLPPAGKALLECYACAVPRNTPGLIRRPPRIWVAQRHQDGLFIAIRSTKRNLVIAAARTLVPMR